MKTYMKVPIKDNIIIPVHHSNPIRLYDSFVGMDSTNINPPIDHRKKVIQKNFSQGVSLLRLTMIIKFSY